ncbi:MAG TPA: membrane dipeptidase [Candidatus Brocadiia bacterium]|nr:membrane dipeptidase [Candidatus Brocadiia bacterium]
MIETAWRRGLEALKPSQAQLEHGLELHGRVLACDNFGFLPQVFTPEVERLFKELRDGAVGAEALRWRTNMLRERAATRDEAAARVFARAVRATGLKCMVQTVAEGKSREEDIKRMACSRQNCRVFRDILAQAGSADEIREIAASGRMAVVWSVNGPPIVGKLQDRDEELSWVQTWYNLGVRLMHLTYNRRNFIGDGCAERANGGLSELGRDLVDEMNRVGIIVDTPHSGRQTTLDAARCSKKPVMASHTGARALFDHMRCKSDEEIKAIADTDGLVGVYVLPNMLGPGATINTMLDHVQHIAKVAGADHVAIGTDTTYSSGWPEGLTGYANARFSPQWWGGWNAENHPLPPSDEASAGSLAWTNWPLYTVGLVCRGFSDREIEAILGGNFLRVLEANRPAEEVRRPGIGG